MTDKQSKPRPLTEKQRRFVDAFMGEARGNATEAARLAGYSGKRKTHSVVGAENLAKPRIANAIQERQENHPLTLTQEQFQEEVTAVFLGRGSVHGEEWIGGVTMEGAEYAPSAQHRLKAAEILARTSGFNIKRVEHSGPDGGPIETTTAELGPDPKKMTADELKELEKLTAAWADLCERVEARLAEEKGLSCESKS